MTQEDEPCRSEGVKHATAEEQSSSKRSSTINDMVYLKLKGWPIADMSGI